MVPIGAGEEALPGVVAARVGRRFHEPEMALQMQEPRALDVLHHEAHRGQFQPRQGLLPLLERVARETGWYIFVEPDTHYDPAQDPDNIGPPTTSR
mgnify:CR=1 FL=1